MAYTYKRNGVWWVGYLDKEGKPRRESAKTKNKTEAKALAIDLEHKARRLATGLDKEAVMAPLLVDLAQRYLSGPVRRNRSVKTSEQRIATHLIPWAGHKRADLITAADVNELLNSRLEAGYSPQTCEHIRIALSAIYTYGIKKLKVLRDNPASEAARVSIPEREPKVLDAAHIPALIANVPERWRVLFAVAVYTGLRKGELLGLTAKCVDLPGRRVLVLHSYDGATKSGKPRVVPVPEELVKFLEAGLEGRGPDDYLFPATAGGMHNRNANLPRTFRNAMKRAGIVQGYRLKCRRQSCGWTSKGLVPDESPLKCPECAFPLYPKPVALDLSFKDLRSSYGTFMYEATDDIRFVQRVLGHHDPKLTERVYAKLTAKKMNEQANRLQLGVTHTGLTPMKKSSKEKTVNGEIRKKTQSYTATRSRGLEPLTSGVTGRRSLQTASDDLRIPVTLSPVLSRALNEAITASERETPSATHTQLTVVAGGDGR